MKPNSLINSIIALWLALQLSGCMGMTIPQTLAGMRAAINGAPNTFIYGKTGESFFVLGWPTNGKYAFMLVDNGGQALKDFKNICGTRCGWQSASDFVSWLEREGWAQINSKALPTAVSGEILQLAYMVGAGRMMPTFLILTPGILAVPPLDLINGEVPG